MKHALVTGSAGFIGQHVCQRLVADGWKVTGLDVFEDIRYHHAQKFEPGSIDVIVHLAALAGVRPSLRDPVHYMDVNVLGTQQILEFARQCAVPHVVFASSSSVYGANPHVPWNEDQQVSPLSPYAASKAAGELLGSVYSRIYGIRFIALRYFTVYGPGQRPDLAIRKFARAILDGKPVTLYGDGSSIRDYTHVNDIVDGTIAAMGLLEPFEAINLGSGRAVTLAQMVMALGEALGIDPILEFEPEKPGDAPATWASITKARRLLGYEPKVRFETGLQEFAAWMKAQKAAA